MDRGAWQALVHGVARIGRDLATKPPPAVYFSVQTGKVLWLKQGTINSHSASTGIAWDCSRQTETYHRPVYAELFSAAQHHSLLLYSPWY